MIRRNRPVNRTPWSLCAVATLATACTFGGTSFEGTSYRCGLGDTCPDDFACVTGVCVLAAEAPDAGNDADIIDTPPIARSWRSDLSGDFAAEGHTLWQAVITERGALEPVAYYTGGVVSGASDTGVVVDDAGTTWADVQAMPAGGQLAIARASEINWGTSTPPGVGLTGGDAWTVWFDGEVWLDAGTWTFAFTVDDHGFLELADAGGWTRVVSGAYPDEAQGTFVAGATGWYPIRWVASDDTGNARVFVRYRGPGVPASIGIPRHRLRVRADHLRGLVMAGFDDQRLVGDHATTIDGSRPADIFWESRGPGDLGVGTDDFSVRWSGQVRIDVAGSYRFRYVTDDGQRLWIDGNRLLNAWDDVSHTQITAAVPLTPGWHAVVIDHSEHVVTASAALSVDSGPEMVGAALPVDRLRPIEARSERYETAVNHSDIAIPDNGTIKSTVTLTAPAGATVRGVDVTYDFTHTYRGDLQIRLIAPDGDIATLRTQNPNGGSGLTERFFRTDLDGGAVAGTWTLEVADLSSGDTGTLRDFALTVHHAAGEPPIPALAVYESPLRDLGNVVSIDEVAWEAREPTDTGVAVKLRTCAVATACASAPWSEALADPAGTKPAVSAARFVQYRVEMTSTGDESASLESIQIDYTGTR